MFEYKRFESLNRKGEYLDYLYKQNGDEDKLPLLVYIHGAGCRGSDITNMPVAAVIKEIDEGRDLRCRFVAPQCHLDTWFELFDVLLEFIDTMRRAPGVDSTRVYICGSSMGGYTVWQIIMSRPSFFAAAVPVCGGGMYWNAKRLINLPIWAFHGALDNTVLPEESIHMVRAVNNAGGNAKLTVYPDVAHNSWERAFADDELWKWMFSQSRDEE